MNLHTINQVLVAMALAVAVIAGVRFFAQSVFSHPEVTSTAYKVTTAPPEDGSGAASPAADTTKTAALAPAAETTALTPAAETAGIAALIAAADPAAGARLVSICKACHTFEKGGPARVGPNLWAVVNREKASAPGFSYSPALSSLSGSWTYEDLDRFLANPTQYARGTKMVFAGVKNATQRAAIIAYLRQQADVPAPLPN